MPKTLRQLRSLPLEELNRRSEKDAFNLKDCQFKGTASSDRQWMPEGMLPLSYLPKFQQLPDHLKMKINQMYAQAICEQFIWFEKRLLCPILVKLNKGKNLPPPLKETLRHFSEEEDKHSELFWRVLEYSNPRLYSQRQFFYFNLKAYQNLFIGTIVKHPNKFLVWVWMAVFFEERTIEFSRQYRREAKTLDPTFVKAHHLHLLEESRHVQMDQYLLQYFYNDASKIKKIIAVILFKILLKSYTSPQRISKNIIRQLKKTFPKEKKILKQLEKELPLLSTNLQYQKKTFGPETLPRTHLLLDKYKEMSNILGYLR